MPTPHLSGPLSVHVARPATRAARPRDDDRSTWWPVVAVGLGALALAQAAGCAPCDGDACGAPPELPGEPTDVVREVSPGLGMTGTITTRIVHTTASVLDDWGTGKQLSQAVVAGHALRLRYCAAHFPPGSAALANLTTAIGAYSALAGVAIDVTDLAAAAGTTTHPELSTFALPSNAIYVDYSYTMEPGAFAGTSYAGCDGGTPRQCTQARLLLNGDTIVSDTDPFNAAQAPSVGVFVHELGHAFGMKHLNEDDDSVVLNDPDDMWFDRTTVHGDKLASDDLRGTVMQAGTLGFLLAYYPDPNSAALATDELVAHRNMSFVSGASHVEFSPSKAYQAWGTGAALIADKNETKLRWNPLADVGTGVPGGFEPCTAPGTLPRWFARMSETSTSTVDKVFLAAFQVTRSAAGAGWTTVAERSFDSYVAGQGSLRQIDWERTFPLSAEALGTAGGAGIETLTRRKLRFKADANDALAERDEANNEWQVNLCLYPASNTTCQSAAVVCAQP